MTTCPGCKGAQRQKVSLDGLAVTDARTVTCTTCKGIGQISAAHGWKIRCGDKIREYRIGRDESSHAFARLHGFSRTTLKNIECGSAPRIVYLTMLKRFGLEVPPANVRAKETA